MGRGGQVASASRAGRGSRRVAGALKPGGPKAPVTRRSAMSSSLRALGRLRVGTSAARFACGGSNVPVADFSGFRWSAPWAPSDGSTDSRRPSAPGLLGRPEADVGALPTASIPSDGGAPPSGPVGARSSLLVALGPRCGAVPCRARPQPSAKLKCSFAPPRARPISMFSGERRVACGPEEKSEAGGSGMNIEIGGSGAPTRRGENFI